MYEFVARKGIVSLKSASFQETVWVSGSISSPELAYITASWALNTLTASVVPIDYNKIYTSLSTGSQNISSANVWQENIFNTNAITSSYWIHPSNTGQFTCSKSDIYDISVHIRIQKTAGANASSGVRILKNGQEITGSYSAITHTSNNIPTDLTVFLTEPIASGSALKVEIAGSTTNIQSISYPIFGGTPGFSHSSKILITKT